MATSNARTRDDAIETAKAIHPIALNRLIASHEQLMETRDAAKAQSARRDEAAAELAEAGVAYTDIARIIGSQPERARQLVARHFGVTVDQLTPKAKMVDRH